MGPPNPSRYPRPQGTLHCQKKSPAVAGAVKLNCTTVTGPEVQGDVEHRLLFALKVVGDATGTFRPIPRIENVTPTEHCNHEFRNDTGLPFTYSTFPRVPVTFPQYGFRSGVQPS